MERRTFPPDVEQWLKETLSRRKTPTVAQLDVIKPEFRRAANAQHSREIAAHGAGPVASTTGPVAAS